MTSTGQSFTEQDVEAFFDQTAQTYLNFWDSEGVLHTGYFTGTDDHDYRAAAQRTSDVVATEAGIDASSYVLDVGCGCGPFLVYLAQRFDCRGEGLDLSAERINFAKQLLTGDKAELKLNFTHGSATAMPYADNTFTHVVSQDAMCLIPDKPRTHSEVFRVLQPGGVFAFSDFLQPKTDISERGRKHVYDRVRWNSGYSYLGYQQALEEAGFVVTHARNLEPQIRQTYRVIGKAATERAGQTEDPAAREWMLGFAESCGEIELAIDRGEFGWGIFVARKPATD
jgi:sarcosine/dimethylglycine N-methyltransferase